MRDDSLFMVMKDPKQWDSWHHSIVAQAQIIDPNNKVLLILVT